MPDDKNLSLQIFFLPVVRFFNTFQSPVTGLKWYSGLRFFWNTALWSIKARLRLLPAYLIPIYYRHMSFATASSCLQAFFASFGCVVSCS